MIPRIYTDLGEYIKPNKVLVLYGPRRVGKTYLLTNYLKQSNLKYKIDNGDDISVQEIFNSQSIERIKQYAQGYDLIAIDEAQNIENIGEEKKAKEEIKNASLEKPSLTAPRRLNGHLGPFKRK